MHVVSLRLGLPTHCYCVWEIGATLRAPAKGREQSSARTGSIYYDNALCGTYGNIQNRKYSRQTNKKQRAFIYRHLRKQMTLTKR